MTLINLILLIFSHLKDPILLEMTVHQLVEKLDEAFVRIRKLEDAMQLQQSYQAIPSSPTSDILSDILDDIAPLPSPLPYIQTLLQIQGQNNIPQQQYTSTSIHLPSAQQQQQQQHYTSTSIHLPSAQQQQQQYTSTSIHSAQQQQQQQHYTSTSIHLPSAQHL